MNLAGAMVLVQYVDHQMSAHPHWHEGDLPEPPTRTAGDCWALGWLVFVDETWVQILHVTTTGQHGHFSDIHRGTVKAIYPLEPIGSIGGA